MATTKKTSTKAKTKTTKAKTTTKRTSPKKTTAANAAKATTANKAAKDVAAKKAAPVARQPRPVTVQRLRSLHFIALGLFLLAAVTAGVFMSNASYQLTIGHVAKDELSGVLVPAVQAIYDVELRWLVVTVMLLAAVFPALYLTRLKERYANFVNNTRLQPWRWIDFAVTGALAAEIVALLSGVSDVPTLKLVAGLMIATAVFGLIAERQNSAGGTPVRSAYYASIFTGLLIAAFTGVYAVASAVYGTGVEWYVYALYAVVFGGFVLLARNLRNQLLGANYLAVERNYVATNILVKTAFAAVLIAGLFR